MRVVYVYGGLLYVGHVCGGFLGRIVANILRVAGAFFRFGVCVGLGGRTAEKHRREDHQIGWGRLWLIPRRRNLVLRPIDTLVT